VTFIFPDGSKKEFPLKTKQQVAQDIVDQIISLLKQQ
jgi:phosphopantothenoylcysteine synthetase/decarboxylase